MTTILQHMCTWFVRTYLHNTYHARRKTLYIYTTNYYVFEWVFVGIFNDIETCSLYNTYVHGKDAVLWQIKSIKTRKKYLKQFKKKL